MIESYYWKNHLLDLKLEVEVFKSNIEESDFDDNSCTLEKNIIIGFLIIRRLLESKTKISINTSNKKYNLISHYAKDNTGLTILNNHDLERHYFIEKNNYTTKRIEFICNQLIHHYICFLLVDERGILNSIYVTSDYEKNKCIYSISKETLCQIFSDYGSDEINKTMMTYNPKTKDYDVINEFSELSEFDDIDIDSILDRTQEL